MSNVRDDAYYREGGGRLCRLKDYHILQDRIAELETERDKAQEACSAIWQFIADDEDTYITEAYREAIGKVHDVVFGSQPTEEVTK